MGGKRDNKEIDLNCSLGFRDIREGMILQRLGCNTCSIIKCKKCQIHDPTILET